MVKEWDRFRYPYPKMLFAALQATFGFSQSNFIN